MIALLGSLLGLIGGLIPNLLKLWQDKKDKEHERSILKMQMEMMKAGHIQRLEEINATADIEETKALYHSMKPSGILWIDALTASVRPVITYCFFALYAYIKIPIVVSSYKLASTDYITFYIRVWSDMDVAIFCTIITFWFGNRTFQKIFIKK